VSRYALAVLTGALVILTGCANRVPSTPATPWADNLDDSLCFFTTAIDPSGLKVQYVYDWGNGDSSTTGWYKSGDTACRAHAFPDTGTFHVKVMARNEQGRASDWSGECPFHVSTPPRLADTIVGFPRWAVDRWYRPSVKVMDPDGDSVSVKFIWGEDMVSDWSPFVASGSTVTDSVRWQTLGRHIIHVLLKDKGSMINPNAGAKFVNVSPVAVLWFTPDSEELGSEGASPTMGEVDGEPVLYIATTEGIVCLRLDGRIKWTTKVGWGWDFAPSLSNDGSRLYLTAFDDGLSCLDGRTGSILWHISIFELFGTPAVGPDGAIYLAGYARSYDTAAVFRMLDCGDSAHFDWLVPLPFVKSDVGWGVTVCADGTIYADCTRGPRTRTAIMAMDASGAVLWQDTTQVKGSYPVYAPAIDSRGRAILADNEGNLLCFNHDGTLAWNVGTSGMAYQGGITVGFDDRIYFQSDKDYRLYCYDSDGRVVWAADIPDEEYDYTSPCIMSDSTILVFNSECAQLSCFSWDGDFLWTFATEDSVEEASHARVRRDEGDGETTPVVGPDGNVYISSFYATYCLAIGKARLAETAWPTYNHDNARSGWVGRP